MASSIHPLSVATSWTREPQQATLYSDWKVTFTTAVAASTSKSNNKHNDDTTDTGSVSTASLTAFDDGHTIDEGDNTDVDDDDSDERLLISSTPFSSSSSSSSSFHASHEEEEEEQQQQQHPQKQEVSFAVHRNMLGPRSGYFTKSFISARRTSSRHDEDSSSSCAGSVIQLPSTLAPQAFRALLDAFAVLLDYCYHNNSTISEEDGITTQLTTENAVALYCLCHYFEMDPAVSKKIQAFIAQDLNQQTIATYYQTMKDLRSSSTTSNTTTSSGCILLQVQPLHDMVAFLCYKHPTILSAPDFLTTVADAALWLSIGALLAARNTKMNDNENGSENNSNKNKAREKESKVWSKYLTAFFDTTTTTTSVSSSGDVAEDWKNVLERKETFRLLTSSKVIPVISKRVALRLLQHERRLSGVDHLWAAADDDDNDDACNSSSSSSSPSNTTQNKRDELDSMIRFCASDSVLPPNEDSRKNEEKEEQQQQQQQSIQRTTTSLQRRCIKALASSHWSGKENDVALLRGSGTSFTHLTTPIVLEELLIGSVIGERTLGTTLTALQADAHVQQQVHSDEKIQSQEQLRTLEVVVIKKGQKNYQLAQVVKHEVTKREGVERKLASFHGKAEEEKKRLHSRQAALEKKLAAEQQRSSRFDVRYQACESSRRKTEQERTMFELTCIETIKRLEALSSQQAWLQDAACGVFSPFLLLFSTRSDRRECEKLKAMLQQVIKDPASYERYFWLKSIGGAEGDDDDDDDDETVGTLSNVGTMSKSDCEEDEDDCTFFSDDTNDDHSIMS